jgi:hypothetical protein
MTMRPSRATADCCASRRASSALASRRALMSRVEHWISSPTVRAFVSTHT